MTDTNLSLVLLMFVACAFHSIPETLLATSTGFEMLAIQLFCTPVPTERHTGRYSLCMNNHNENVFTGRFQIICTGNGFGRCGPGASYFILI